MPIKAPLTVPQGLKPQWRSSQTPANVNNKIVTAKLVPAYRCRQIELPLGGGDDETFMICIVLR